MERAAECLSKLHEIDKSIEELLNALEAMTGENKDARYYEKLAVYHWSEMSIAIESAIEFIKKQKREAENG